MSATLSSVPELAERAMAAIDKALADKPERNGHDFSAAVCCLTELREALLTEHGGAPPVRQFRDRLSRLNAVISIVVGGEYPIGSVPWRHVEEARDSFAKLLAELKGIA